jgi:Peptidase M15
MKWIKCIFCLLLLSCSDEASRRETGVKGEYIYRLHEEYLFRPGSPQLKTREPYPWEEGRVGQLPKISKEYFRCKGSSLNPTRLLGESSEPCQDCGGTEKHSLPLRDGKEFIYPILIGLLNEIQIKSGKRVVITSGHRCPEHNRYVDPSPSASYSKHMIGAAVTFYVQGCEERPESIVNLIQEYYQRHPKKEYAEFKRYEKEDTDVTTPPWYNKEIFIKLYKKREGRDLDNRHPYPYISLQVRYDTTLDEKVTYSWEKAYRNYLRK